MFQLFKKKFDAKKEKLKLIARTEQVRKKLGEHKLYHPNARLDKIADRLDDPALPLTQAQARGIAQCLTSIERHAGEQYEQLLLHKCAQIEGCLESEELAEEIGKISAESEDRLFEMLGELCVLERQVQEIETRMDAALGADKNLWEMLNSRRTCLKNKMLVIQKNYRSLLAGRRNLILSEDVRLAKEEAERIALQSETVDVRDFTENVGFTSDVETEVTGKADALGEIFAKNFGAEGSDFAYERALEEKLLEEAGIPAAANAQGKF